MKTWFIFLRSQRNCLSKNNVKSLSKIRVSTNKIRAYHCTYVCIFGEICAYFRHICTHIRKVCALICVRKLKKAFADTLVQIVSPFFARIKLNQSTCHTVVSRCCPDKRRFQTRQQQSAGARYLWVQPLGKPYLVFIPDNKQQIACACYLWVQPLRSPAPSLVVIPDNKQQSVALVIHESNHYVTRTFLSSYNRLEQSAMVLVIYKSNH